MHNNYDNPLYRENPQLSLYELRQIERFSWRIQKIANLDVLQNNDAWFLKYDSRKVSLAVVYSWNPEKVEMSDKIYFLCFLKIFKNVYVLSYDRPWYKHYTTDPFWIFEKKLKNWGYNHIINRLLKQVRLELKLWIYSDFQKI